jgi:ABC-type multidrug transport system fused ATPase/permease subunit
MVNNLVKVISLLRAAYGRYKFQIALLAVLGFASGLLEGVGINALIPLFSFVMGNGEGGSDFVSRQISKFFGLFDLQLSVSLLLLFIAVMFVAKAIFSVILDYLRLRVATDYEQETRWNLFEKVLAANWGHLLKQKLGYLESILMVDVSNSANLLGQLAGGVTFVTGLLIYVFIALNISLPITLLTLALGAVFFVVFRPILLRIKILAMERNRAIKQMTHHVSENILGMKTVKTMLVENAVAERGREYFATLRKSALRVPFLKSITNAATEPFSVIFISLVFAAYYRRPDFNLAVLVAIVYLVNKIFNYVQQVQRITQTVSDFSPYLRSVVSYESASVENREIESPGARFAFERSLEFRDVSFSYDNQRSVLSGLNFSIRKGEMAGLIGPSGAGKTTVADLLLRLFKPKEGKVLLDGRDAREIDLRDWRAHIGYVSQDIFLMNDTIGNNIRFYNLAVSQADVEAAARMANIHDFIETLPAKYETVIGERGVRLSGGERQRVVLARVLARKPSVLILDEATSALDNESEAQIQKVIKNLKGEITVFVIAHRLSTIADVDNLLVMDQGGIVEQGLPKDLLENRDSYFFRVNNIIKEI